MPTCGSTVVCISSLTALIMEFVGEAQRDKSGKSIKEIQLVYITPENLVQNCMYRNMGEKLVALGGR